MKEFQDIVSLLIEKNLTIAAAESCTGGMFISHIVDIPDASRVLSSSFVTYSEEAKIRFAGVDARTIEKYGVVSENVAVEMAKGVSVTSHSDIGVGITGFAGQYITDEEDLSGLVCFGFYVNGVSVSSKKQFGDIGRNAVREAACIYSAKTLLTLIKKFGDKK